MPGLTLRNFFESARCRVITLRIGVHATTLIGDGSVIYVEYGIYVILPVTDCAASFQNKDGKYVAAAREPVALYSTIIVVICPYRWNVCCRSWI